MSQDNEKVLQATEALHRILNWYPAHEPSAVARSEAEKEIQIISKHGDKTCAGAVHSLAEQLDILFCDEQHADFIQTHRDGFLQRIILVKERARTNLSNIQMITKGQYWNR